MSTVTQASMIKFLSSTDLVQKKHYEQFINLKVLKYKKKVFYKNKWNVFLEECRGTVVDDDFNIVSLPFKKIYNYGIEQRAPRFDPNETVISMRKVNGFMGAMSFHNDDILISTTGSLDSQFVDYMKEMMQIHASWETWKQTVKNYEGFTLLFECVHPSDPHIIPEDNGVYILGIRRNKWGSPLVTEENANIAQSVNCHFIETNILPMWEVVEMTKTCKHEGFVVYSMDGNRATKIKSPHYLTAKFLARNPNLNKIKTKLSLIDEEFYGIAKAISRNFEWYSSLDEQERLEWIRERLSQHVMSEVDYDHNC